MSTTASNFDSDMPETASSKVQKEILGENYSYIRDLGQGTYGKVIEAWSNLAQQHVAIKFVSVEGDFQARVKQEIGLQRATHGNPNVLRVLDVLEHPSEQFIGIVLELMPTDLHELITNRHGCMLEHSKIWCYFAQLIMALEHLHSKNILHRDIKASNCLISHNNYLKLADFGAAKMDSVYHSGRTYVGTPGYIAPEVRSGQSYGKEADLFSAGGILFHLYTTREPQEGEDLLADKNQLPDEFKTLIMQLRHDDSTRRPSASSLLNGTPGILQYRMEELNAAWSRQDSALRREKDYYCEELRKSQFELTEKNEKIKELDNKNASLMQTVQQLRVEVEDKEARIKLLEPAAGPYVYRPLVFDHCQILEDLDQVRAAWKIGLFMGAD